MRGLRETGRYIARVLIPVGITTMYFGFSNRIIATLTDTYYPPLIDSLIAFGDSGIILGSIMLIVGCLGIAIDLILLNLKTKHEEFIKKAKQLADEHWSYVEGLLNYHNEDEAIIKKIGFHYRTAMIHGYKHGLDESESLKVI